MSVVALKGEEREVALAEVQAVRAAVPDGEYREQLDAIHAALERAAPLEPEDTGELERLITIALQSGSRARALRAGRRAGAAAPLPQAAGRRSSSRRAPPRSARRSRGLQGKPLEQALDHRGRPGLVHAHARAPAASSLNIRLDRQGARLASVEA